MAPQFKRNDSARNWDGKFKNAFRASDFIRSREHADHEEMRTKKSNHRNALKHGAFSATAILPGEDAREFSVLHISLREEWQPEGCTEDDAVLDIAKSMWRKRRVQKLLEVYLFRNSLDPAHPRYDEDTALTMFGLAVKHAPERAFEELKGSLRPQMIKQLLENCPRAKFETPEEWGAAVVADIELRLWRSGIPDDDSKVLEIPRLAPLASLITDDLLIRELELDERLSAIIDRAVKRLVQTKAMKQMLATVERDRSDAADEKHGPTEPRCYKDRPPRGTAAKST